MSEDQDRPPREASSWNLDVEPGDPAEIFGRSYFFDRVDPDLAVTFRPPSGSNEGDFMIEGEDGRPRRPVVREVAALMIAHELVWREKPLRDEVRRHARAQERDAEQARAIDKVCQFRMAIGRLFDAAPWSRSDASLVLFMKHAMQVPEIAAMPGAWHACPATIRTWINDRGTKDCRKERDGIAMTNRTRRLKKLGHPLEVVAYWAARATNVRGSVQMNYDRYVADVAKINAGEPLDRNFAYDPDGNADPGQAPAAYPVPPIAYQAMPYNRFWRLCGSLKSEKAYSRKTTAQAAYQRYGGGGSGEAPSHLGALCSMDSTPVPKAFFVDDRTGIPIGEATMTLLSEHRSKVVAGWDLCPGASNSSAVLSAKEPKDVPPDLLRIDTNLTWLRLRPDAIRFDNATEQHGRSVETALADAYIATDYAGSRMPRDKNVIERILGTFLELLFKHQADAAYDVARMRLYGFDPEKRGHVLCSIATGRRLLARAVMTYNMTRARGLDGRQPALVWKQLLGQRKLKVIKDVDEFKRNIGTVDTAMMTPAGIEKFNRRYTAGFGDMKRVIQQFERAAKLPKGDLSPAQRIVRDDRKRLSFKVRIKVDEDDIGVIRVWNPHAQPARWEDFGCTNPTAHGMPRWLHDRCREFAEREAMDYLSPEGQAIVRARLFEDIAKVDTHAAESERRTLARALDDRRFREVMAGYVEVTDEADVDVGQRSLEASPPAPHEMAIGARDDADVDTPRPKLPTPQPPVRMRRLGRSEPEDAAGASQVRPPAPRRVARTRNRDANRRLATDQNQSAARPGQRAASRVRTNRLKWGEAL